MKLIIAGGRDYWFDDETWDRFFDFLYCEELKPEEVRERLTAAGIDITPALQRVQSIIRASLERAKDEIDHRGG